MKGLNDFCLKSKILQNAELGKSILSKENNRSSVYSLGNGKRLQTCKAICRD